MFKNGEVLSLLFKLIQSLYLAKHIYTHFQFILWIIGSCTEGYVLQYCAKWQNFESLCVLTLANAVFDADFEAFRWYSQSELSPQVTLIRPTLLDSG